MSEAYIINSMGQSPRWVINQAEIVEELKKRWDSIEIKENVSDAYILRWAVEFDGRTILGGIQTDYQTLTIDGGAVANIADFLIWYRTLVPEQYPLFLYKGSKFDNPIKLSASTSKDELVGTLMHY